MCESERKINEKLYARGRVRQREKFGGGKVSASYNYVTESDLAGS